MIGDGCEAFQLRGKIVSKGLISQNVGHGEPLAGANAYEAHALAVGRFGPARQDGDKNLFHDGGDDLGLSKDTYSFIGGLIEHADEICSITNPTINSYKRINGLVTSSGATWAPNTVTFAGNNRTHMVRAPGSGRFGFRLADGVTNAYLFPATGLACGLDGIAKNAHPGKPLDIDMYADGHKAPAGVKTLPLNLLDALRITDGSALLRRELGDEFVDAYVKLKMKDWNEYSGELTPWYCDTTLNC